MTNPTKKHLTRDAYTVALICPLEVEMSATRYMLDEEHARLPREKHDTNQYILGQLSGHNVVVASLPEGSQGNISAATVAAHLTRTFPSIKLRLLVGIGGGVPSETNDIHLGDVVVSVPSGTSGGVIEYDLGKQTPTGFVRKGFLCPPPTEWRNAITMMMSDHRTKSNKIMAFLSEMLQKFPQLKEYQRPPPEKDILFRPDYEHNVDQPTCENCDRSKAVKRVRRGASDEPVVFYGLIASGNRVIKHAAERDRISKDSEGAICFEMEAAGLMNDFRCIVIRGISDYSDSHKNDEWHPHSAAAAAGLAKELLHYLEPAPSNIPSESECQPHLNQAKAHNLTSDESKESPNSIANLKEMLKQEILKIALPLTSQLVGPLSSRLIPSLEKTLSSVVEKRLRECLSQQIPEDLRWMKSDRRNRSARARHTNSFGENSEFSMTKSLGGSAWARTATGKKDLDSSSQSHPTFKWSIRDVCDTKRRRRRFWKHSWTPFGDVALYCHELMGAHAEDQIIEIGFCFIPRRWLAQGAFYITGGLGSSSSRTLLNFNLQHRPVVNFDSKIFEACERGDISCMKNLFDRRQASPYDVNPSGETLLLFALKVLRDGPNYFKRFEICKFLLEEGCPADEASIIGENPLDDVFSLGTLCRSEMFESDLKVTRLLVENGRVEQWHYPNILTFLLMATCWQPSIVPPALEYLCKQDRLDFTLNPSRCYHSEGPNFDFLLDWNWPIANTLNVFLACDLEISALSADTLLARILKYFNMTFEDSAFQKEIFNGAVLEFAALLRHGLSPHSPLFDWDPDSTASAIVRLDPQFTEVAWNLALKLSGWEQEEQYGMPATYGERHANANNNSFLQHDNDAKTFNLDEDVESGSEYEDIEEHTASTSPCEVPEMQPMPGGWVSEDEEDNFPIIRKFQSKEADFNGEYRGSISVWRKRGNLMVWEPDGARPIKRTRR